ncbi:Transposase [Bacteroidales bacterium Barb6XT]|nr:Transposase [Bacteroidales bacterium Barb6XT]
MSNISRKKESMKCPKCSSEKKIKAGVAKGRQRYKCKDCGCELKSTAKPDSLKKQALHLYLEGLGFRSTGRLLGVSNVSVLNWIRNFGEKVPGLGSESKEIEMAGADEMHSYTGSKKTVVGYGLPLTDTVKDSPTLLSETGVIKRPKGFGTK